MPRCIIHVTHTRKGEKFYKFTKLTWKKVQECSVRWANLIGTECGSVFKESLISKENEELFSKDYHSISDADYYHMKCYKIFANTTKLARAEKANAKPNVRVKKLLRSSLAGEKQMESHIFAPICVICDKKQKFYRRKGKQCRDKLMKAETIDGGK